MPDWRRVATGAGAMALVSAVALGVPLLRHQVDDLAHRFDYATADDPLQRELVRAFLQQQLRSTRELEGDPQAPVYFDLRGAMLCSLEQPEPCGHHDPLSAERDGDLVDRADLLLPEAMQWRLDRETWKPSRNPDPQMPDVLLVDTSAVADGDAVCRQTGDRPLHRMSRAVVDDRHRLAIAFTITSDCQQHGGSQVLVFRRVGDRWSAQSRERY